MSKQCAYHVNVLKTFLCAAIALLKWKIFANSWKKMHYLTPYTSTCVDLVLFAMS